MDNFTATHEPAALPNTTAGTSYLIQNQSRTTRLRVGKYASTTAVATITKGFSIGPFGDITVQPDTDESIFVWVDAENGVAPGFYAEAL